MSLKILKIGGSVLTYKNLFSELNLAHINNAIGEVSRWLSENPNNQLILIAGAGSFGHIIAHDHGVNNPTPERKEDYLGFLRVAINMQKMGNTIAGIFEKSGIRLFPISTSSMFITDKGRIVDSFFQIVPRALASGLVPLFWGDSVFDNSHLSRILSGDQIATYLCERLEVSALLYGTNVGGIYHTDPYHNPDAKIIRTITDINYQEVLQSLGNANSIDVTHGMKGKIMEIYEVKRRPIHAHIFDARVPGNIFRALKGMEVGTEIQFEQFPI